MHLFYIIEPEYAELLFDNNSLLVQKTKFLKQMENEFETMSRASMMDFTLS